MEMSLHACLLLCCLIDFTIIQVAARQDRGTLYFPEGKKIELKCQNITEGLFASVYWYSTAYAKSSNTETTDVYRYDITEKTHINGHFENRIERINETSLRVRNAKLSDSGKWKCDILYKRNEDEGLTVKSQASYVVHIVSAPGPLDIQPRFSVMGNIGGRTTVFCESVSLSPFVITWHKKVGNFTKNADTSRVERKKVEGYFIIRVHLDFSNLSKEDTGIYLCVAKNVGGQKNRSVTVRIKSVPRIINTATIARIDVYRTGKLVCRAKGYPKIDFEWNILEGKYVLGPNQVVDQLSVSRTVYSSESEQGYSVLTVKVVDKDYLGRYTCIAKNLAGNDDRKIELSGLAPPDPPSIIENLVKAEEHRITIYWRLKEEVGAPTKSVSIEHRNSSSINNGWTRYTINKAIRTYTVSSLVKGTSYTFRIQATNEIGNSKYSKIVTTSTKGDEVIASNQEDSDSDQVLGNLDLTALIGIFGGAVIALLIGFLCICVFVRKMQKNEHNEPQTHNVTASYAPTTLPQQTTVDGRPLMIEMEPLTPNYQVDHWEFPRDRLTVTTVLGAGAFGVVMRGLAQGIKGSVGKITVAVKTVRDNTNEAATKDLMAELNLLKLLPEHTNVVGLLGCCTRTEPIYVIVEYCANGDLQGFLRSSRGIYERYYKTSYGGAVPNLTSRMLLTFAWQVAKGMSHLASMKVIHRDLAARNILVDDQLICKVSDFGFARDIYVEDHYLKRSAGGRFPIKWMAIESLLDGISTTKSDVWSFGVVLWELVTLGASPYPGMNSYEVVSFLQDGYRMDKPKHCSNEIYQLMMDCWNVAPGRRPSFNDLAGRSQDLIEESDDKELINMNFYPDHLYVNFDGAGTQSQSVSTATTPHGTLTRKHVVNMHQDHLGNGNAPASPRAGLRSPSGHTMRNGRTNSVTALSERSVTGASTSSCNTERYGNKRTPSYEREGLLNGNAHGPS